MSDHILESLGAYLDGELQGSQLQKVESHLDECQVCMEEYRALIALSRTLREAPLPEFHSPERFSAEVALRLSRKPVIPMSRKALEIGWWMVPVGLMATWIFIGTTILVSNMVTAASELGLLSTASTWLVGGPTGASTSAFIGQFGLLDPGELEWLSASESFAGSIFTSVFWQVSIAMLYLSWMAIWWARHMRKGSGLLTVATSPHGKAGSQQKQNFS